MFVRRIKMNQKDLKSVLAPFGVTIGIALLIGICHLITTKLGISKLDVFIPRYVSGWVGLTQIIMWGPILFAGIYSWGQQSIIGESKKLVLNGIYHFVRNPIYVGVSFSLFGFGLLLNETSVVLAGIIWFIGSCIQGNFEEQELTRKYQEKFVEYQKNTPMLIPDFYLLTKIVLGKSSGQNVKQTMNA